MKVVTFASTQMFELVVSFAAYTALVLSGFLAWRVLKIQQLLSRPSRITTGEHRNGSDLLKTPEQMAATVDSWGAPQPQPAQLLVH